MKYLGIDPGEKNIGVAISDPTGTLARPLIVLPHVNRKVNAYKIAELAKKEQVDGIIIGQATDIDGKPNFSGRKAARLAGELGSKTKIPITLWDESYSTQAAKRITIQSGVNKKNRQGHQDELAAAVILQSYLDSLS